MTKILKKSIVFRYIAIYALLAAIAMIIRPSVFTRYFIDQIWFSDAGNYHVIATSGYSEAGMTAFFPLWPLMIATLNLLIGESFLRLTSAFLATAIFFISIPLMLRLAKKVFSEKFAYLVVAIYVFNPNSIFHAMAFAESLASLCILGLCWYIFCFNDMKKRDYFMCFSVSILLSLTRPAIFPILCTVGFVGLTFIFVSHSYRSQATLKKLSKLLLSIASGTVFGYLIYGSYCYLAFDNFWAPFSAQQSWGRVFGFYWSNFFSPSVINGSDQVLLWDTQAFYLPFILVGVFCYLTFFKKAPLLTAQKIAVAQFSIGWALAHACIQFLTLPYYMSIGRHIFVYPSLFLAIGIALDSLVASEKIKNRALIFYAVFSGLYLGNAWLRYGNDSWIG